MMNRLKRKVRGAILVAVFAVAVLCLPPITGTGSLLAQGPPPAKGPAPLPSNVTVPGRMYVLEGIVVVLLFAGAIFGVCRTSGRT